MAPKASRQKGKGAASDKYGAPSHLPKGSWEGSWVKERRIELLRQGRVLPPTDLVGCRPAGGERVPAPQHGETVGLRAARQQLSTTVDRSFPFVAAPYWGECDDDVGCIRGPLQGILRHLA
jgi:hypothetical protein